MTILLLCDIKHKYRNLKHLPFFKVYRVDDTATNTLSVRKECGDVNFHKIKSDIILNYYS